MTLAVKVALNLKPINQPNQFSGKELKFNFQADIWEFCMNSDLKSVIENVVIVYDIDTVTNDKHAPIVVPFSPSDCQFHCLGYLICYL